jgi:hypothetical protein
MSHISADKYYIASDDITWCKDNFIGDKYVFFDINDDMLQMIKVLSA